MLKRSFGFKVKQLLDAADPDGSFEGLLAVYNNVDLGGDAILPGAFTRNLQNQGSTRPLLWQHQPDKPIGTLSLEDSPNALKVKGQLLLGLPMAQEAYQLLQAKVIKGLSIGYDTIVESFDNNNVRVLKELKLWEGSLVTFPMNEAAMVTAIKSNNDDEREVIAMLKKMTSKAEEVAGRRESAAISARIRRGK